MELEIDAAFGHGDAFGFKEFALETGVGFTNEEFASCAEDAMPRDAFAGRTCRHRMTGGAGAASQA